MVGLTTALCKSPALSAPMKKQFFGSSLLELCQFFPTFSRKGWAKTRTLVKEMTCVLYSWKICWSGGCLIENLSELADFFNLERRHRSDPGGSESFVAAPQDCWTGITFFQSDSHGIHGHVQEEKNIPFFVFPQMVQKTSHHIFFQKEGNRGNLYY